MFKDNLRLCKEPIHPAISTSINQLQPLLDTNSRQTPYGVIPAPSGPPEVKRLCGSGAVGQSALLWGELGKPLSPLGSGFGCLKLLLSENSDWDSAAVALNGERTVWPMTLTGTTRLGLLSPGGGDGESLPRSCGTQEKSGGLMEILV